MPKVFCSDRSGSDWSGRSIGAYTRPVSSALPVKHNGRRRSAIAALRDRGRIARWQSQRQAAATARYASAVVIEMWYEGERLLVVEGNTIGAAAR
jgi:hypothetical protein